MRSLWEQILSFKSSSLMFFPLRAVPYGMEITFVTLDDLPSLNSTIFITHVRNNVMGATPMNIQHYND